MAQLRPPTAGDHDRILDLAAARDAHDFGVEGFTRGLLNDEWRAGGFDAILAEDDGRVVGYAALFEQGVLAFVDPAAEGRGAGSALLEWAERQARRHRRRDPLRQVIAAGNANGRALLERMGYTKARSVFRMALTLDDPPAVPWPPGGVTFEPLDVDRDAEGLYHADQAAFALTPDFVPTTFERFRREHLAADDLDPTASFVARRSDRIAGFVLCRRWQQPVGFIDLLAVDAGERQAGLGTALVLSALASFSAGGCREARLDVASDNVAAVRLYERLGMRADQQVDVYEKPA